MKKKFNAIDFFSKYGMLLILIILIILFSILNSNFYTFKNIMNLLRQNSVQGIICVGMAMVLITGGIDLSVGSTAGISSVVCAYLLLAGVPWPLAIVITLIMGFAIGFLNGFFINVFRIPPFIATLGMMTSLRGLAYVVTQAKPVTGFGDGILWIGKGSIAQIPIPAVIMAICFILGYFFLERTRYGTYVYGVGGNEEATRLSGVNPKMVKYIVYIVNGVLSALAGIILMARVNGGQPKGGDGYEMAVITSVVLGGVSISGGEGRIGFVIVGVFLMGVLSNGLIMNNVSDYVQQVVSGIVLILAVAFDRFMKNQKSKKLEA